MITRYILPVIYIFIAVSTVRGQDDTVRRWTDEEFLVEAFFPELSKRGPKIYLGTGHYIWNPRPYRLELEKVFLKHLIDREELPESDKEFLLASIKAQPSLARHIPICEPMFLLIDRVLDDFQRYYDENSGGDEKWDAESPVFKTRGAGRIRFDSSKSRQSFSKPLFSADARYALVVAAYYSSMKYGWRYRLRVKPWKHIFKAPREGHYQSRYVLLWYDEGKWVVIGYMQHAIS